MIKIYKRNWINEKKENQKKNRYFLSRVLMLKWKRKRGKGRGEEGEEEGRREKGKGRRKKEESGLLTN